MGDPDFDASIEKRAVGEQLLLSSLETAGSTLRNVRSTRAGLSELEVQCLPRHRRTILVPMQAVRGLFTWLLMVTIWVRIMIR